MSGLEVCRDVLGAFPTLLAALDHYRTGFSVLKFSGQNDRDIYVLRKRVHTAHMHLSKLLETLFEPMGIEIGNVVEWDSTKMTASTLDALLQQRQRFAYPAFVELMSSIAFCLSELVRRFEKLDSTSAQRTKLRLLSSREDIERLVRKLTDYTICLQSILLINMSIYTAHTVESIKVRAPQSDVKMALRNVISDVKLAQRDVRILYNVLYPAKERLPFRKVFLESFRIAHSSRYRRQLQLLLTPPFSSASRIRSRQDHWLKVCIDFDRELEERSEFPNPRTGRELDVPAIELANSIDSPTDKQWKSVRFQKPSMSQSEVRQQSRPAKVFSLSEFSRMFHASESPSKYGPILIGDPAMLIDETDMLSLRDILRSSIRISHVSRIRLAASLTWDVICLLDTPWMKRGLKVADIFFTKNHDVIRVDDLFICHSFDHENIEQADPISLIQGQIFRLGVILFELSLHENIEDLQEGQQSDGIPDEFAERLLISRMIDDVYLWGGIKYGDLVRKCVSFQFDSSLNSQHPKMLEEMQKSLIREVFSPLEDLLELFGSLDSEATINLAGSQAKGPKPKLLSDDSSIQGLYTPSTRPSIDTLPDDPSIDDRASTIYKIQGLQESSTRPPLEDFCLEHLPSLHQYASEVCQKGYADTFAFARVMLAAKETLLSIAEADNLAHRIVPDSSQGEDLLNFSRDCLMDFVRLETFRQGAEDREALDDLTNRFILHGGSLALFNKRVLRFPSNTTDSETSSVISASETDVSSIFDGKASASSAATSLLEPIWADSRQVANEFLSLIRDEALLGPLLMSVFEELEALENIPLRGYLLCLLDKYSEELLLQARQESGTGSQRQAAMMIYYQASYIVDKMYAEYSIRERSASKMLEQVMLRIPGEVQEQRSQRVSRIVASFAKVATRSKLPERKPSIVSTDGSFHQDYSAIPASMIQTGFERRSAASLGFTTMDSNAKIVFVVVKDFLVSGVAFAHLRLALRDTLQQKPMDIVRQEVFSGIPSSDENSYDVTFHVYWDIRQYIKNELTPRQTFASVLTVSGGSRDAFATPCGSYMQWLWSDASIDLLDALNQTMKSGKYVSAEGSLQISEEDPNQSDIDYKLSISVVGTKYKVSEVAQQLVWLSNVLRTTYTNELSLSRMEFMWIDQGIFELRPGRLAAVSVENEPCWHPLLGKSVIADGFPIPPRNGEVGLELPFQSLIRLSKVDAEMEFDNRVVLYGTSSLLYPTSLSVESYTERTTPRCIQWHLIAGESPHLSASLLAEDQDWVKVDDKTFLPTSRSIVGYCKFARILVGTEEYNYDKTKGSELSDDESMPGVNIKSINLGTGGVGVFGVQVAMDIVYPRSVEVSPEITKYDDILVSARTMSMILYDAGEHRGWLLPVQHVLLHMAQCWIKRHTPGVHLPYAKPEWEGENAVEKILTDNYKLLVKTLLDDDSEWFLRDLIKQIWRDLQGCRIARKQRKSEDKASHTLPSAKLLAWDFLDFIERPPEYQMKKCPMDFSGCGWAALAEDDEMMILACRGLGDVIIPADTVQICNKWSTVPSNRAYLTASISCMRVLPQSAVGGLCMSLTKRVFWRPTAQSLLDDCAHRGHTSCSKSLQRVITKVDAAPIASAAFPPSGAVVFGVNRLHRSLKQFGEVQHRRAQKDESDEADKSGKKSRWHIFKWSNR